MLCAMKRPSTAADEARVKNLLHRYVMADALQSGAPVVSLVNGLLQTSADLLASAVILDQHNKALCMDDDDAHIEAAADLFKQRCRQALSDARRDMLQPVGATH